MTEFGAVISPAVAFGIGYAKELNDPFFSKADLKADMIGIGSAVVVDMVFRKLIFPERGINKKSP
jgi:hypothetical protein